MIQVAADMLEEIHIAEREIKKAEQNLSEWTNRLVIHESNAARAKEKYQECIAEIFRRREGN